jgi:carboxypeptidase PM20D1
MMASLWIASALIALLLAAAIWNTARFRSRQLSLAPGPSVPVEAELAARRLAAALRFQTVSYLDRSRIDMGAFVALHAYLEETFPRLHERLQREVIGEASLLYTWEGSDPQAKPILFVFHLDVVPANEETHEKAEDRWRRPPFAGEVAEGYVWGRGALDLKQGVMAAMEAIEHLAGTDFSPWRTICLAVGHDEEIGGDHGNGAVAAVLRSRGIRLECVFDEGGFVIEGLLPGIDAPVALVNVAEKGSVCLELCVEGEPSHAAMPAPETAIGSLCAALRRIESRPFSLKMTRPVEWMLDYLGPEMRPAYRFILANRAVFRRLVRRIFLRSPEGNALVRTTIVPTMIGAGVAANVVPPRATAVLNVRILPGDAIEKVIGHIRKTVADSRVGVRRLGGWPGREASAVSSTRSFGFVALQRTVAEVFPGAVVAPGLLAGATDSRHYEDLAESTFRFIPTRLARGDLKRIHGLDERIAVESYGDMIRFYVRLIENVALPRP